MEGSVKNLQQPPSRPGGKNSDKNKWTLVGSFWLQRGPLDMCDWAERDEESGITRFVMTPTGKYKYRYNIVY